MSECSQAPFLHFVNECITGDASEGSARKHIALSSNGAGDKLATQRHLISYKVNRRGHSRRNRTKSYAVNKVSFPYDEQTGVVKALDV